MWSVFVLLALIGGLAAGTESPWRANREYTYDFYARTLTGLPDLKNQFVGVVSKGKILLQTESDGRIFGKLIKMGHAHYHDDLVGGWDTEIREDSLSFQESELNNKEFILTLKNGVIRTLQIEGSLTNDEVNQFKAIISQLQLDVKGENLIPSKDNQLPEGGEGPTALFKIMEPTVTGECETVYDIQALPEYLVNRTHPRWVPRNMRMKLEAKKGQFFQVVKTLNYDNCQERKGYHFGITGESKIKPNTNQMGDFLSKSTVSKIIASGVVNDFTIQQICTTNRISVSPGLYHEQKAQVVSQIHMVLAKMQEAKKKLKGPQNRINVGSLVYRYNLPSDESNKIRENSKNSRNLLKNIARNSEEIVTSDEYENFRIRRSLHSEEMTNHLKKDVSKFSESYENIEDNRDKFQPFRGVEHSPEIPLLPFTVGFKGRNIKYGNKIDLKREARRLAEEISNDLQNQDEIPNRNTLEKFDILIQVVRLMNFNEIEEIVKDLRVHPQKTENLDKILSWKTFRDAVAEAGTPPSVKIISKMILERQIQGDEAAGLITALSKNIQIPNLEVVRILFDLIKNDEVQKQKTFYPTALIAVTDLIRRAEIDRKTAKSYYPIQTFGAFYKDLEKFTSEELIPYFAERLHESVGQKDAQKILLYIRILGNTGHPDIVGIFEKYIEGDEHFTHFERMAAILAMDRLTLTYPKLARRILYKVYANVALTPETRTAAVHLLMRTNPSTAMLQRMAIYTHEDPSETVQAVVKSSIQSASKLKGEHWRDLAEKSDSARKFLNPRDYGRQYSKTYLKDYVSENLRILYDQQLSHIIGRDHIYPQTILYRVIQNFGGYYERNSEIEAMISSVDDLINLIPGSKYTNEQEQMDDFSQQGHGQQWSTKHLESILNLKSENDKNFEGQILFNILGHKRFMVFDEKTLEDVPRLLTTIGGALRTGQTLSENKFYSRRSLTIAFPLVTGYPFVYTLTAPTLAQAVGKIQGQTSPDVTQSPSWSILDQIESVNMTAQLRLVYSSEMRSKVGFVTPFEHHEYVTGHVSKIQGYLPLQLKIDVDIKNRQIAGKVAPLEEKMKFNPLYASDVPFTLRRDIFEMKPMTQSKGIKLIKSRPSEKFERIVGEKTIGMSFRTEIVHQIPEDVQTEIEMALNRQGIVALSSLPFSYHETMKKIWNRQAFSTLSMIPFSYQPSSYAPSENQIALTLAALPIAEELTTKELIKLQGILSLVSLPFADIDTLQRTVQNVGVPSIAEQWPLNALDGYKIQIQYDGQRSTNEIIKFGLNFEHAYNLDKDTPIASTKLRAAIDEKKLAFAKDSSPNSSNRRKQFLENAAYDVRQASSIALDASLSFEGQNPAEFVATIAHAASPVDEKERIVAFLGAKKGSKTKQICLSYVGRYPKNQALSFEDTLKMDLRADAKLEAAFGENCMSESSQIKATATMEQTPEYKEQLQQSVAGKVCAYEMKFGNNQLPACQEAIYRSNILDDIKISAEVENPTPEFKNITHRALNILRYIGFWNLDENINEKGEPNKFEAAIKLEPNLKYLNAAIQIEDMILRAKSLNILPPLRTFVEYHPQVDTQADYVSSAAGISQIQRNGQMCVIDKNKILTFDDKEISEKLGKCWYSLVQYFAPKRHILNEPRNFVQSHPVSVLARESSTENGQKEVLIAVRQQGGPDHIIHLKKKESEIHVTINGKEHKISKDRSIDVYDNSENAKRHQKAAVRLYHLPGQEAKVDIRDQKMQIFFDGARIKIQAEPTYRGNLRGICGNFNGEEVDDVATPKNCILRSEKLFIASWALTQQPSCSQEVKGLREKADQTPCALISTHGPGNVISQWEAGRRSGPPRENEKKWSSEETSSGSSSSSSEESHEKSLSKLGPHSTEKSACNLKAQFQIIKIGNRTCFTLEPLDACPAQCAPEAKEHVQVGVHCRPTEDARTQLFIQQHRKGIRPHLGQRIDLTVTFNVPRRCVPAN